MLDFPVKSTQGEKINFGSNDTRNIVEDNKLVNLNGLDETIVNFSNFKNEKCRMELRGSDYPLILRSGFY